MIAGAGRVVVLGGTTELLANNTYTGGTTIDGGVLRDRAAMPIWVTRRARSPWPEGTLRTTGNIVMARATTLGGAGGTLDTQAFNLIMNAPITGTGALIKIGSGTLVLTADNSYTGLTNLGRRYLAARHWRQHWGHRRRCDKQRHALVFNRSNELVLAGAISGSGSVQQIGTGTTVLLGRKAPTPAAPPSRPAPCSWATAARPGSIVGDVTNNGTLVFNRSNDLSLAGAISGSGALSQVGSGTTTLSGNSAAFSGGTAVTNGTLRINGVLGNAPAR